MKTIYLVMSVLLFSLLNAREFITGANLAGWQVLEPWASPSIFYISLGKRKNQGAFFDTYTFCDFYGPTFGNQILKGHWERFFTL